MESHAARPDAASSWFLSRRLFLSGIAATYAIAFGSLGLQVRGLYGSQGIVPLAERMQALAARLTGWQRLELPTLLWFGASDTFLCVLCLAGVGLALLVLAGILPRYALALLWLGYLSWVSVGDPFLNFQWDALLLEAGFLAIFFAPGGWRPFGRGERAPARSLRWLLYWLLFRLMVLSGAVKLTSGDPSWRDGTALDFHYWTQPLPHRLSYVAHGMPEGFKHASVLVMFAIELGVPWLLLVPWGRRRLRLLVAAAVVFLMALISATGNYGFFNLLTAVLCIPLLDDRAWRRLLGRLGRRESGAPRLELPTPGWRHGVVGSFAGLVFLLTSGRALEGLDWIDALPGPLAALERGAAPLASFHAYGLFRVMTRERPEIEIEGSLDGVEWKPYGFRYKPLELERAPVCAGLHMPRLDWQLWFAALDLRSGRRPYWLEPFLARLLEGSPAVLGLLGQNPFPDGPPRFVRGRCALYEFSSQAEHEHGLWWRRNEFQTCLGPLSHQGGPARR